MITTHTVQELRFRLDPESGDILFGVLVSTWEEAYEVMRIGVGCGWQHSGYNGALASSVRSIDELKRAYSLNSDNPCYIGFFEGGFMCTQVERLARDLDEMYYKVPLDELPSFLTLMYLAEDH